ncbi:hypothetical protein ATANTOWER_023491 [Ataeniobius toweri]|uniref:Uncharacterized protein n=1 Tax=Ataeniobius toweri TaxID=208326 RepID=A0ABU7B2J7_9TELE|nr:hypothetical protein [Ataeniobius toweri]
MDDGNLVYMLTSILHLFFLKLNTPPHREDSVEGAGASIPDASWTPPSGGVPGTSHREEAQGTAQDTLGGLSAGLRTPWAPSGGAGRGVWGEGHLGVSTESAAPTTRFRMKWQMTGLCRAEWQADEGMQPFDPGGLEEGCIKSYWIVALEDWSLAPL